MEFKFIYNKIYCETPLWIYLQIESNEIQNGNRLGKLSSILISDCIYNAIKKSSVSIFDYNFDMMIIWNSLLMMTTTWFSFY